MPARALPEQFLVAFSFAGEQRDFVRQVAEEVERAIGPPNVFFDEWFEHYIAGDDADLKLQRIYDDGCVLAVVCVSGQYGGKPWTLAEHQAIRARQLKARASAHPRDTLGILPIRVGDGDVAGVLFNTIVPDVRTKSPADVAVLILDRLRLVRPDPAAPPPVAVEWPAPAPLLWPMANHADARAAFEILLGASPPWRLLLLRGPSEVGKSHITRQMLGNALRLPGLACGRFDFKGTTDMDGEVRAFVQDLGIPPPPTKPHLNERLGQVLDAIKRRAQPTLLILDTYEAAGEAEEWVDKQLLLSLIRATWLRVVIAGQRVPARTGAVMDIAAPVIVLKPPPARDWFDYAARHRPDLGLTLADVEQVCRLTDKPGVLASLFGPQA
jgi:hypothetical protein